jgi:hypothetical protein
MGNEDYGLIIKNDSGEVQIDSTYKNYALAEAGSYTVSRGFDKLEFDDSISTYGAIIVTKADANGWNKFSKFWEDAGSFTHVTIYNGNYYHTGAEQSLVEFTLYWRAYTPDYKETLPTYGMVVKNPDGDVVFSSEDQYLKIVDAYTGSCTWDFGSGETPTYDDITVADADNNYFFLTDWCADQRDEGAAPSDMIYSFRGFKKINSTTIRVGVFRAHCGPSGTNPDIFNWVDAFTLIEFAA